MTVDTAGQVFTFDLYWISTTSYSGVKVYVLSDPGYATQTEILSKYCYKCGTWQSVDVDASPWRGQAIKLKFEYYNGPTGIDNVRVRTLFPDMTTSGPVTRAEESGNDYAVLESGGIITTGAFTVDSATQYATAQVRKSGSYTAYFYIYALSGIDYNTETQLYYGGTSSTTWTSVAVDLSAFVGQSIKLKYRKYGVGTANLDEPGMQRVEVAGWEGVTEDTRWEEESGNHFVSTNGELFSQLFTLPEEIDHLTLRYRGGSSTTIFYVTLYGGANYQDELFTMQEYGEENVWNTLKIGVGEYAGQPVKLKLEQYWGRLHFDDVGYGEKLLPGWTLNGTHPFTTGEDANGSYVTPIEFDSFLVSSTISTGIVDTNYVQQRYYSLSYAFGDRTGSLVRVWWTDAATQDSWVVFQDASNVATDVKTEYFWLADFMGTDGYFEVQVPRLGKVYAIADNIARVQLSEPFSEQVGQRIDTSTGSFGYQETDIKTEGLFPLTFTRYYAGHSDHYGAMGFRWRHTYDIRLEITDDGDAGVIYGSGREVFFDEQSGSFEPADARVHDELVLNPDGTYTYTTSTNLDYLFDASGVLQSITDLNGNQVTLTYNGSGQLTTITGLGSQVISLTYDGNGRLSTVTDPENQVWTYAYDANGDLVKVTDPDLGERDYEYSRHRLTRAINPLDDVVFENVLDDWNRVLQQKDADQQVLTLAYDTPGVGATEITDPESNTATYYFDKFQRTTHVVDPLGNTVVRIYDADGNLEKLIDPGSDNWQFAYSATGDLTQQTDPLGNTITITYNTLRLPLSITDGRGKTTTFTYDGDGNMLTRTDPLNHTWTYTYDAGGNMLSETNPLNQTTTWTYNSAGNMLTETNALNEVTSWTYDNSGRVTSETDPLGNTETYTRASLTGDIKTITDRNGAVTEFTYDKFGNLLVVEDGAGFSVSWVYNSLGQIVARSDQDQQITTYAYDANGRMVSMTDPLSNVTSWSYDDNGRLASETDPLNNTWTYTYDAAGRLASETDPMHRTTSYSYDDAGHLTSKTMPNGGIYSYAYDANGNLISETGPMNRTTTYAYDDANRLVSKTDPLNNAWTYSYDAAGRLVSMTDPNNHTTTMSYDAAGRRTAITDALSGVVQFTYDAAGNVISRTNPNSQTTSFTYDALGNVLTETDPLNNTWTYTYDALSNVQSSIDPRNVQVNYGYNARGDLTSITYPGGGITFGFDNAGRRTSMTDATGTTTWTYDAASQITSVAAPNGTVSYTYNAAGQRSSMTLPGSRTVSYGYDATGLLASIADWQNRAIGVAHNAAGERTAITRPNGVSTSVTYDGAGRTASVVHSDANGTLQSYGYAYDGAGNRSAVTTGAGTEAYTYDALNRLTNITYPNSDTVAFTYDANGNRLTYALNGQTLNTYTYDAADRMLSDGTHSYSYDAAGNQLTAGSNSFTWDWAGQLATATIAGTTTTYRYDGDGVRTGETTGGVTTPYLWDRLGELPMLVDDGTTSYLHSDGVLAEIDGSNAALYHLNDDLGSVRGLTDTTGALVGTTSYSAFGATRSSTGVTSRFGFVGEQYDSGTGYTFLRARYLNTQHGRFISRDSVQPNAPGSQGYNRYAYVANNPCTWTDPSGHSARGAACAILVALSAAVMGWLIGKHQKGTYYVKIVAAYTSPARWAALIAGGALSADYLGGGNGEGLSTIGGGIITMAPLFIGYAVFGNGHMSLPTAFAILLAGVLLFLAAVIMHQIIVAIDIALNFGDHLCAWMDSNNVSPPEFQSPSSPDGSDLGAVRSASTSLPSLPGVSRPTALRPSLS